LTVLLHFLPFQTRLIVSPGVLNGGYFEHGTVSLYGSEILLWLIVILVIADFFINRRKLVFDTEGRSRRFKISVFLFFCFFVFLLAHPTLVTFNYLRLFLEGILLFLIIRLFAVGDPTANGSRTVLVWGFVGGGMVQALLGIQQFFSQTAFASKWLGMAVHDPSVLGTYVIETDFGRWLRAYGSLPHPNILAGYLVAAILLLIIYSQNNNVIPDSIRNPEKKSRISACTGMAQKIVLFILPILTVGLFFTFSRSAWIALIVGLLIFWITRIKSLKSSSLIIGLWTSFVAIICLTILLWPLVSARTAADSRLEIKSSSERMSYYGEAWTLIKKHPFLGVGLGNYVRAVHNEIDSGRPAYAHQPVHNVFVLALAELGAIGMLIIATAIFVFRRIISWKKLICLAPFLIVGLFDHYLWSLYPGIILWVAYAGLIL